MPDWIYWAAGLIVVAGYLQRERLASVWRWITSGRPADVRLEQMASLLALRDSFAGDGTATASIDGLIAKVAAR